MMNEHMIVLGLFSGSVCRFEILGNIPVIEETLPVFPKIYYNLGILS